jgi:P-type Cu+ transporter
METAIEALVVCAHCGNDCPDTTIHLPARNSSADEAFFCCEGCKAVYEILAENDLCAYYTLSAQPGKPMGESALGKRFDFLDNESIAQGLLDFVSENLCRVTFQIPSIHCSSCIWLLENLYRLREGISDSRVNFLKKELSLSYHPQKVSLREIVELMTTLGYEPSLSLETADNRTQQKTSRALLMKIGVTGFCTGNIMLLSLAEYFGWQLAGDVLFQRVFMVLNVVLSLPVFFYGAWGYLTSAWQSLRKKIISIDVPLALGISTLYGRSLHEILTQTGPGYFDSLAGLVFFLLVGKWVQNRTYESLSFERSYKSYFPLAATRLNGTQTESVPVNELQKNDRIRVLNQGLVVADSILLSPEAQIDYSFVTGEAEPVTKKAGELIYAGGRQVGPQIELLVQKPVSQSYLTQLWNNEAFAKEKATPVTNLAAQFSRWFTWFTLALAVATALYWWVTDERVVWNAFTAVLMVACPCALSLSMPFTMGTVTGILGRNRFYVKNPDVIGHLANVTHVVFDKTGTLTQTRNAELQFTGTPLNSEGRAMLLAISAQSAHPLSRKVQAWLRTQSKQSNSKVTVSFFREIPGHGIEARIGESLVRMGSVTFAGPEEKSAAYLTSRVFVSIDGRCRGYFSIPNAYRTGLTDLIQRLKSTFKVSLLSGDHRVDGQVLQPLFGQAMHFEQSPEDKLQHIKKLQETGETVLMVGDGLNDAGALRQSDVGLVLTDDVNTFFPACDVLLEASQLNRLPELIRFSRTSINIVKVSFLVSVVYNIIGLSWAVSGNLSPVFAAILMPVSSLSVVLFAVGGAHLYARWRGLKQRETLAPEHGR